MIDSSFDFSYGSRYVDRQADRQADAQEDIVLMRRDQMARADAAGQREAAEDAQRRALYSQARAEVASGAPEDTPYGSAYLYASRVARMKSFAATGQMGRAHDEFKALEDAATRFSSSYIELAATRPRDNAFDTDLNASALAMSKRAYATMPLTLRDGTQVAASEVFSGGKVNSYFKYDQKLDENFDAGVAARYRSDDAFEHSIFQKVVDPVAEWASIAGHAGASHPHRGQLRELGNYLDDNFDDMRKTLGDRGMAQLVVHAVDRMSHAGCAVDGVDFVCRTVKNQLAAGVEGDDPYDLVVDALALHDELSRIPADPSRLSADPSPSSVRYVQKMMSSVAGRFPGVDFRSESVKDAMKSLVSTGAEFERFRVPFLSMLNSAGVSVRDAAASFVQAAQSGVHVPDDNPFVILPRALSTSVALLAGGFSAVPSSRSGDPGVGVGDSAYMLGATSGDGAVDGAVGRMVSTWARRQIVPEVAAGRSSGPAVPTTDVVGGWTDDLSASFGWSPDTASAVASAVASGLVDRDTGGMRPVDLRKTAMELAMSKDFMKASPKSARELRRWFAASGNAGALLRPRMSKVLEMLADPVVGHGISQKDQLSAAMEASIEKLVGLMQRGIDPTAGIAVMERTGRWLEHTGKWEVTDEFGRRRIVSPEELVGLARASVSPSDIMNAARPQFVLKSGDLDTAASIPLSIGATEIGGIGPGAFSRDPDGFRATQEMYRRVMNSNMRIGDQQSAKASPSGA